MARRDLRRGAELAYENGKSLLEEAEILARRGRYGYSLGLTMLAVEELAKAEIYVLRGEGVSKIPDYEAFVKSGKIKTKEAPKAILNHETKFGVFFGFLALSEAVSKYLGVDEAIEQGLFATRGSLSSEARWFVKGRQRAFYVDFEDDDWYSPLAVSRAHAEFLLGYAGKYSLWVARILHEGWFATRKPVERKLGKAISANGES
jgi:AbiV family abortive infection protein